MTDKTRIKVAAGVTALFLAGISVAGLAVRADRPARAGAVSVTAPNVILPSGGERRVDYQDEERGDDDGYEERDEDD